LAPAAAKSHVSSAAFRCILHGGLEAALQKGKTHFFVDLDPLAELDFGAANIPLSGPH
jgi:hypothetical protein